MSNLISDDKAILNSSKIVFTNRLLNSKIKKKQIVSFIKNWRIYLE